MKKFLKVLVLTLAFWQALFGPAILSLAFAQEVDSTPLTTSPSPSPDDSNQLIDQSTIQPSPSPSPEVSTTTGDATAGSSLDAQTNISQVTLTPDPSQTPTPTPTSEEDILPSPSPEDLITLEATDSPSPTPTPDSISIDQSGTVSSNSSADSNSGENTQTASKSADLTTGNATSTASNVNVTNLAEVNSNLITTVQNIYTGNTGDVNLYQALVDAIAANPNSIPANADITTKQNADVTTNTESSSNSGENTQSAHSASMTSGDAIAIASAITATNLNLVGSNMVLAVINILGDYSGDIILPNGQTVSLASLGITNLAVNTNQTANVNSNTEAGTNTGENSQTGKSAGMITGDATSISNTNSFVNLVQIGGGLGYLIINNSGNWTGNLINWTTPGSVEALPQGTTSLTNSIDSTTGTGDGTTSITSDQTANVNANVSAVANTGKNTQDGKNLTMTTGNAFSLANNLSLTNITGVGTNFFFAIINIFGNWTGNIFSGPKPIPAEDPAPDPAPATDSTPDTRAPDLSISVSNNVGAFVYPGDTILANITVTNQGGIMSHNVEVKGQLTNDHPMPAIPMDWKIGDLKPGGKAKISFSITLTSDLPNGQYKIAATATGNGESGNETSVGGDSSFWVKVKGILTQITEPQVLAESTTNIDGQIPQVINVKPPLDINKYLPYILASLGAAYIFILLARKKLKENAKNK